MRVFLEQIPNGAHEIISAMKGNSWFTENNLKYCKISPDTVSLKCDGKQIFFSSDSIVSPSNV